MATAQTDKPTETVEELLERANRATLEGKTKDKTPAVSLSGEDIKAICADKDKLRALAIEELVMIVSLNKGDIKGVQACNVILDRVDGKPAQSVTTVNLNTTIDATYGLPEAMRIDMMRHKVRMWDEDNAKTIENEQTTL